MDAYVECTTSGDVFEEEHSDDTLKPLKFDEDGHSFDPYMFDPYEMDEQYI